MKFLWIALVFVVFHYQWDLGCMAAKSRRSSKKHKTDNPSNPSLAAIQETPGRQPKTAPKIKETSLPSATAAEGDNPSLNNPKNSDDDSTVSSPQSSTHSSTSSTFSSPLDLELVSAIASAESNEPQKGQLKDTDDVPSNQNHDSNRQSNTPSNDSNGSSSSQTSDNNSAIVGQTSDSYSGLNNQIGDYTGINTNPANEQNAVKSSPYTETNNTYNRVNNNVLNNYDANTPYNWQAPPASLAPNNRGNEPINNQVSGLPSIGSASAPVQIVVSSTNNSNNTAMNGNIGQPAPELIVPVAVSPQSESQENNEKEPKTSGKEIKLPINNNTASNTTKVQSNLSTPIASNVTHAMNYTQNQSKSPSVTVKLPQKTRTYHKGSKKNRTYHKRSKSHHHHRHKRRRGGKRSKRPYSEPVPETGIDKTTPKFDWSQYQNMTKLIAKIQGGGSDIPTFNIGKLLSLIPSEVGIKKQGIPTILHNFVNHDGSIATQDDIAKMDREAVEADKTTQALQMHQQPMKPSGFHETKKLPDQNVAMPATKEHSEKLKVSPSIKDTDHSLEKDSKEGTAIIPEKTDSKELKSSKEPSQEQLTQKEQGNVDETPESTTSHQNTSTNDAHSKLASTPLSHEEESKPLSLPISSDTATTPQTLLSLFSDESQPTVKTTIADTVAADTGQKINKDVKKAPAISLPENIPKECVGLIKSYTNAEMTMKEYLQKMRRCKYINNPNKNRYQQVLLKKGDVNSLANSDAEIKQQAYKYAMQRMKVYVPSKKDTADANAIMEKWRTNTFGNSASTKSIVPDAIKSFMSGQSAKKTAAALAAADLELKSSIKEKTRDQGDNQAVRTVKSSLPSHMIQKSGVQHIVAPNKEKYNGKVTSSLIDKSLSLESSTNLELFSNKKTEVSKPLLSLSKLDDLQKAIEGKASGRNEIPEVSGLRSIKPLLQLTFKDAVAMAAAKSGTPKSKIATENGDNKVGGKVTLSDSKSDNFGLQSSSEIKKKNGIPDNSKITKKPQKSSISPAVSDIVNANLIRALQSMGPGQGFGLLGNKGVTLITTASKRSAEKEIPFFRPRAKTHQKRHILGKSKKKNVKRDVAEKDNSINASERSRMDIPPNIKPGPKLMDKIRDMSSVIATP